MENEQQRLIDMLVARTGQPREKVEAWVAEMLEMLEGSLTVYDVSRMVGKFIAKHTRSAKPFLLRFGRSLLQSFADKQRRIQEQTVNQTIENDQVSKPARSGVKRRTMGTVRPVRRGRRIVTRFVQSKTSRKKSS